MRIISISFLLMIITILFPLQEAFNQNYIAPNLAERLTAAKSDEMIRINIRLEVQMSPEFLELKTLAVSNNQQRRKIVVEELRSFSKESQKELLEFLGTEEKSLRVSNIRPLWIVNLITCYATPEAIEQLSLFPGIARIDYDRLEQIIEPQPPVNPKDNLSDKSEIAWNITLIDAPQVWEQGYTGEGIVVAVLDTGVNPNHQDLAGRMWEHPDYPNHGYNFVNNNFNTSDIHSHGTHCAGTVAGNGASGTTTGVAPEATIMALKVLNDSGGGTESGVWEAIEFSVDYGAHIMSLSLGWRHSSNPDRAAWRTAMANALQAGVIAAVAAGNEGSLGWGDQPPPNNVRTPGDCPAPWTHPSQTGMGAPSAAVTVGSTTSTDGISDFSSRGPVTWQNIAPFNDYMLDPGIGLTIPDVVAPGSNILSLSNTSNTGYTVKSGTSMAAPAVAGLMALMLSKNPNLTPEQISQILETTTNSEGQAKNNTFGSGRVNALTAIAATPYAGVRYAGHTINDSEGNNDGKINAGETIALSISLENPTENPISNISISLSVNSEYITVTQGQASLGSIDPDESSSFENIFTFQVADNIPGNYEIDFVLHAFSEDDDENIWRSSFREVAYAQHLTFLEITIDDSESGGNTNGLLDPGETAVMIVDIKNTGQISSEEIQVTIEIDSQWLMMHHDGIVNVPALNAQEKNQIEIVVTALHDAPLESLVNIGLFATSGAYSYEAAKDLVIGEATFYSLGNIPSTYNAAPNASSNAQNPGVLTVSIPENATITGVDIEYSISSVSGAWQSEQRSVVRCVSPGGISETQIVSGPSSNVGGTATYKRSNLNIANNVTSGSEIEFELHVFRTWGGSGSNTQYAFVPNNTWKIVVHYEIPKYDVTFKVSNQLGDLVENATITIANSEETTDDTGEVSMMLHKGLHFYNVEAEKHRSLLFQTFQVTESNNIIEIEIIRAFEAQFSISDIFGNPVENYSIILNEELIDNDLAVDLDAGEYQFSIEAEGFAPFQGDFTIVDNDITMLIEMVPYFDLTFHLTNPWGYAVDNALISIDGNSYEAGQSNITDMIPGVYDFSINAPWFHVYNGQFEITDSNLDLYITLDADGTFTETPAELSLNVFPNPATEVLFIAFDHATAGDVYLTLYNQLGQEVLTHILTASADSNHQLDISGLKAGIYSLYLRNGTQSATKKILIN